MPSTISWSSKAVPVMPSRVARDASRASVVSLMRNDVLAAISGLPHMVTVSSAMSLLRLSGREEWWKDAEIRMLGHQLDALRERPRAPARLTWPDRAWLALLAGMPPIDPLAGMRLIVTPPRPCPGTVTSSAAVGRAGHAPATPRPETSRAALPAAWRRHRPGPLPPPAARPRRRRDS